MLKLSACFSPPAIKRKIIKHTNEEGALVYVRWNEKHTGEWQKEFKELDLVELDALIGVLILRGVFTGRNENIYNLWTKSQFSRLLFTACMARDRFWKLLRLIRFDDHATRAARKFNDNFAPIREVFDIFNKQLRKYLTPTECLTIEEMLAKFQGNARFRV